VVLLLFRSQERLLFTPRHSLADSLQKLRCLVQTLAPTPEFRGILPCRDAEAEFRVLCASPPDCANLFLLQIANPFRQFQNRPQSGCPVTPGDLLKDSKVHSEDLPLAAPLFPHGEFPEAGSDAVAIAVSLSEPPHQKLDGRFVPPELGLSRDRRCFRLFKDHLLLPTPVKIRLARSVLPLWEGGE